MKRCPVCEGILPDSRFLRGGDVCRVCVRRLREVSESSGVVRKPLIVAHLDLLKAIHVQAVVEGDLETWEDYWLKEEPWVSLWDTLKTISDERLQMAGCYSSQLNRG